MLQNYRARPALGEPAFSGGAPYTGAWIRSREPRLLDAPLAAALLDTWFPAPFVRLERPFGAPTIDYTVHFRSPLPPPGAAPEDAYLVAFRSEPGPPRLLRGRRRAVVSRRRPCWRSRGSWRCCSTRWLSGRVVDDVLSNGASTGSAA